MSRVILLVALLCSRPVFANLGFSNLTDSDVKQITRDLGANFSHRSVSGASSLGAIFGVEAVLVAGSTASSNINELSVRSGGGELKSIATAGLLLGVSVPFGVTFEYLGLPNFEVAGARFSGNSVGLKWQMNDVIPILPVNLSLRLNNSTSTFGFTQDLGGGLNGDVSSDTTVQEASLYFSPKLPFVEPYVGLGMVSAKGSMSFTGNNSIFTVGNSASATVSGTKMAAGVSVQLPFFSFGLEYVTLFGTTGYGAKLGVSF